MPVNLFHLHLSTIFWHETCTEVYEFTLQLGIDRKVKTIVVSFCPWRVTTRQGFFVYTPPFVIRQVAIFAPHDG